MLKLLDPLVIKLLLLPLAIIIGILMYYPIIPLVILCSLVPLESLTVGLPVKFFPLLGVIIGAGYVFNTVIRMNHPEHKYDRQIILDYCVMLFLVLCFIWNPEYAWGTTGPLGQKVIWAITYIQLAVLYFLSSRLLRGDKLAWLGLGLMLGTTLSAIYALMTTGFSAFHTDARLLGIAQRLEGAQGDPNYFAAYALCGLALLPAVQKLCRNKLEILLVTLIGGFQVIIVIMTMSKTGFLALAFLMLIWFFSLNLSSYVKGNIVIVIGLLFIAALVIQTAFWMFIYDKIVTGVFHHEGSMGARFNYWYAAYLAFKSAPIFGIGVGQFPWFTLRCSGMGVDYGTVVHNAYLTVLAETGIVGIILFLGLIGMAIYRFIIVIKKGKTDDLRILALSGLSAFAMILFMALTLTIHYNKFLWLLAGSSIAITLDNEKLKYSAKKMNSNLTTLKYNFLQLVRH